MAKQLSGFEKLKAKQSELNGGAPGDRFIWRVDPTSAEGQQFQILNPFMLDEAQRDEVALLRQQARTGEILPSELGREMLDIYIDDDERDDFEELAESGGIIPADLLNMILEEFQEKHSPTRRSSSMKSRQ